MLLEAPSVLLAYNQCSMLPRRQQTSNKWRYRKRLPMLLAHNHAARSLCCACQPWQYRTANRTASGSLQCCGLQPRSMLPLLRLPTVAIPHCTASGSLQCCGYNHAAMLRLPTVAIPTAALQVLPSMLRLTTKQHAPFNAAAYNHAACSLCCATVLLAVKLPAVNCQPSVPAEKAACRSCCPAD
jgi:hypothetical protein